MRGFFADWLRMTARVCRLFVWWTYGAGGDYFAFHCFTISTSGGHFRRGLGTDCVAEVEDVAGAAVGGGEDLCDAGVEDGLGGREE